MINPNPGKPTQDEGLMLFVISSFLITAFLFFLDEGNYNFYWMTSIITWFIFLLYAVPIFIGQLMISKLILKKYRGSGKALISILGGSAIGLLFVLTVVF